MGTQGPLLIAGALSKWDSWWEASSVEELRSQYGGGWPSSIGLSMVIHRTSRDSFARHSLQGTRQTLQDCDATVTSTSQGPGSTHALTYT